MNDLFWEGLPIEELKKTIDILTESGDDPALLKKVTEVYERQKGCGRYIGRAW